MSEAWWPQSSQSGPSCIMFSFGAYRFAIVQAYVGLLVLWCSVFPMLGLRVLLRLDSIRAQAADALEYVFTAALRQHIVRTLCKQGLQGFANIAFAKVNRHNGFADEHVHIVSVLIQQTQRVSKTSIEIQISSAPAI